MNPEQLRRMQQMQGEPQQQGGGKPKQVPWYDRFGWWTVLGLVIVGGLVTLLFLPPLK